MSKRSPDQPGPRARTGHASQPDERAAIGRARAPEVAVGEDPGARDHAIGDKEGVLRFQQNGARFQQVRKPPPDLGISMVPRRRNSSPCGDCTGTMGIQLSGGGISSV